MTFRLSKWYLDCVTPEGNALIAYVAEVRYLDFAIRYTSLLELRAGRVRVRTTLRGFEAPSQDGATITWSSEPLGVSGTWRALVPPVSNTIFASQADRVQWQCAQPASAVAARVRDSSGDRTIEDLGYAEHVTMTLPPWQLPIDELHWGRFVAPAGVSGEHDSIVWIDWRGRHATRLVFRNGNRVESLEPTPNHVVLRDGTLLALGASRVLRAGPLGTTVLSAVPLLAKALPSRMLGVRENKWCSRATLTSPNGPRSEGWAIHEVVSWS